jgi:hypothetical protein
MTSTFNWSVIPKPLAAFYVLLSRPCGDRRWLMPQDVDARHKAGHDDH